MVISRRDLLVGSLLGLPLSARMAVAAEGDGPPRPALVGLEHRHGGRLAVAILDTGSGRQIVHRGSERVPLCSTHKLLSAAFVLARVDRGEESLARRIVFAKEQLPSYTPVTEKHVGGEGMTIAELCEAALTWSDNGAANLLLDSFGGPGALTGYVRSIGDSVTRLDRREPELNDFTPGDPRDTTTAQAMVGLLRKFLLSDMFTSGSRDRLATWLVGCKTGDKRIRAGVPQGWRVGDKTGSGSHNATNDVAIIWPPDRTPILVAAYYVDSRAPIDLREAVLAEVGGLAAKA
jgi:beta-lactamase class A